MIGFKINRSALSASAFLGLYSLGYAAYTTSGEVYVGNNGPFVGVESDTVNSLSVGRSNDGSLKIDGGSGYNALGATFGFDPGVHGSLHLTGLGTSFTAAETLAGMSGTAHILIEDQASYNARTIMGGPSGGMAELIVRDTGTQFTSNQLTVGSRGTGQFLLSNGANANITNLTIGSGALSSGVTNISNHGTLATTDTIFVGNEGQAELHVAEGASVSTRRLTVGVRSESHGLVTVNGQNTSMISDSSVNLGYQGSSVLNIEDGASFSVRTGNLSLASEIGSEAIINVGSYDRSGAGVNFAPDRIILGDGSATINFNQSNNLVVDADITGSGTVVFRGTGITTLTGLYENRGNTIVESGSFGVNGRIYSEVTVAANSSLSGTGTYDQNVTVKSGATISPGNSPGTITFRDQVTLEDAVTLAFELGNDSDLIDVTSGNLNVLGTLLLNITASEGFAAGDYKLIDSAMGRTSGLEVDDFIINSSPSGYHYSVYSDNSDYFLSVTTIPEPTVVGLLSIFSLLAIRRSR